MTPTILKAASLPEPKVVAVDGTQIPMGDKSLEYTFATSGAKDHIPPTTFMSPLVVSSFSTTTPT